MTPPSINEVTAYVTGVVRMIRDEPEGLQLLDLSAEGFWRSFWAIVYSLPAYLVFWTTDRLAQLTENPEAELGVGFFLRSAVTDLAGIAAALLAVAVIARPIGISDRFVQWVVAGNWLSLPLNYVMAAITLFSLGLFGFDGSFILVIVFIAALVISWRVYRVALDGDGLLAFGILVLTQIVFVLTTVALG
ncbi:hypothetical protein [Nitratireductor sp. XY-223]|uniref:hypothetical protein n=1 Tax=Nitratireductor sp. XY-223 TaxID=2561926 RepID=UPI0010AB160D|nr:hypothetical protein [Nitratireductor sp. XY-223]